MIEKDKFEFDNEPVANLLHDLKRVDAPKDFDFKVRARIAQGRPSARRGMPAWVKAAVPLGLVLAAGGYIGLNSMYSPTQNDVPEVAAITEQPRIETPTAPAISDPQVEAPKPVGGPDTVAVSTKKNTKTVRPTGGSIDSAVRQSKTLDIRERSAGEAFSEIGVKGTFETAGMKVDAADEKHGLKTGDVIESVNGRPLSEASTVKGGLAGKTIRVRRDGKTVEVVIKN